MDRKILLRRKAGRRAALKQQTQYFDSLAESKGSKNKVSEPETRHSVRMANEEGTTRSPVSTLPTRSSGSIDVAQLKFFDSLKEKSNTCSTRPGEPRVHGAKKSNLPHNDFQIGQSEIGAGVSIGMQPPATAIPSHGNCPTGPAKAGDGISISSEDTMDQISDDEVDLHEEANMISVLLRDALNKGYDYVTVA